MKKVLLLLSLTLSSAIIIPGNSNAQTPVLELNFDGYLGTEATTPAGYYFSWHSTTSNSFYISAGNFGAAPPSYKFGNNGDFIITPVVSGADSLTFWAKGNGSPFSPLNELKIYHSADSINWTLDATIVPLSASGTNYSVQLGQVTGYLKMEFMKVSGNLAFDDLKVYGTTTGIQTPTTNESISVYPAPTNGPVNIKVANGSGPATIEVFDMLGNQVKNIRLEKKAKSVYTLDLSGMNKGLYFVKIQTSNQFVTRRVTLTN
jgi:hypothetical protein